MAAGWRARVATSPWAGPSEPSGRHDSFLTRHFGAVRLDRACVGVEHHGMPFLRACLVASLLMGFVGSSHGATPIRETVAAQVMGADSLRGHTFSLLARGDVTGAIDYWVLATGKDAPAWLFALKTAFDASKQMAGACQEVARSIHMAFTQLGGKPELVELTTRNQKQFQYIVFKMPDGRDLNVSRTGYHVLVRMNDRAYDAYTGVAGMPWAEYLSRLGARSDIIQTVVDALPETP